MIFNLDFPTLKNYQDKFKEFQTLIKVNFPVIEEIKGFAIEHKVSNEGKPESSVKEIVTFVLNNKEKTKTVSLQENKLIFNFKDYIKFEEFQKTLKLVLDSLFNVYPEIISRKIGLRYINQINFDNGSLFDWNNLIESKLLTSIQFIDNKDELSRHLSLIEITKDEYQLRFQYGFYNSMYPSPIIKKEFMLDLDCFSSESFENSSEILKKVEIFNKIIGEMFEKSISNGLREIMRKE